MADQKPDEKTFNVVGSRVPRVDAVDKVTGRAKYGADHNIPGQLYGAVKYADYPHAKVVSIDTEKAKILTGVRSVLTHEDIPGEKVFGAIHVHQVVLCFDKVRFLGDVVAIVAAETQEIAEQAIGLIKVEYEPLPIVSDPVEALTADSPLVHKESLYPSCSEKR
jgi:CO/xanthine dehydrogenase Mo-binding subunit